MSLAIVHSRALTGLQARPVEVEVHLSGGLPSLSIVGLPEAAVRESKDRVRSALLNSRFEFPSRRITVNLAPADLPKEGGRFDLAIAIGILVASGQLPETYLQNHEFLGELALGGNLRPVPGVLPSTLCGCNQRTLVVPQANAPEAAMNDQVRVLHAQHLLEVCTYLKGAAELEQACKPETLANPRRDMPDMAEVRGQTQAKRVLEIAAAGRHNLLMVGPPGAGKSMLAARLPSILPPLTDTQALQSACIRSVSGTLADFEQWHTPAFRAPHHTASAAALVGGGSHPKPGEISLAHCGVLFLDEAVEFDRRVLEALREPMETGVVTISRAAERTDFPARFQLLAAINPCPCGYLGDPDHSCGCSAAQVQRYRQRLSGPLLDRIDLHIEVRRLPLEALRTSAYSESSADIQTRVRKAQGRAWQRVGKPNADLTPRELDQHCSLDSAGEQLLATAHQRLKLSARGFHRLLRVARTIADLAGVARIHTDHLAEALSYRLD